MGGQWGGVCSPIRSQKRDDSAVAATTIIRHPNAIPIYKEKQKKTGEPDIYIYIYIYICVYIYIYIYIYMYRTLKGEHTQRLWQRGSKSGTKLGEHIHMDLDPDVDRY